MENIKPIIEHIYGRELSDEEITEALQGFEKLDADGVRTLFANHKRKIVSASNIDEFNENFQKIFKFIEENDQIPVMFLFKRSNDMIYCQKRKREKLLGEISFKVTCKEDLILLFESLLEKYPDMEYGYINSFSGYGPSLYVGIKDSVFGEFESYEGYDSSWFRAIKLILKDFIQLDDEKTRII